MPDLPTPTILRLCSVTGKVHIRWDAHTTVLLPAGLAEPAGTVHLCVVGVDEDEARLELARRFLAWLAPPEPLTSQSGLALDTMMPKRPGDAWTGNSSS